MIQINFTIVKVERKLVKMGRGNEKRKRKGQEMGTEYISKEIFFNTWQV